MGYNQDKKIVLDEAQTIGLRYSSLLHCASRFAWLTKCGFRNELRHLYYTCGLNRSEANSSETLLNCINEIDQQRSVFLKKLTTFAKIRKKEKLNGRRSPTKKSLSDLYALKDLLLDNAIK